MRGTKEVHEDKKRWRLTVGILSILVVIATAAVLMIPAMTLEDETEPGYMELSEAGTAAETSEAETDTEPAETETENTEAKGEEEALPVNEEPKVGKNEPAYEEPQTEKSEDEETAEAPARVVSAPALTANGAVITANVTLENAELKEGQFTFELLDADTDKVLQTAVNDEYGDIEFDPIYYDTDESGIYRYKLREVKGNQPNITYDSAVHIISVGVEKGDASPQTLTDKYYGVKSTSPYGWYMSSALGKKDYFVYCLDATKPSPTTTATSSPYWIAEPDPDNDMLKASVNHTSTYAANNIYVPAYDGWSDSPSLKENLKKILYTVTYGSLSGLDGTQKAQLIWWAASGQNYLTYSSMYYKYVNYMNTCLATTVPAGYELVLFHPSDGLSQPFITLLRSGSTSVFYAEEASFTNIYNRTAAAVLKAQKTLDGHAPGDRVFSFQLLDTDSRVLQIKENDEAGNIVFDPISYTKAGTYCYTIREVDDRQPNVIYDDRAIAVTVVVTTTGGSESTAYLSEEPTVTYSIEALFENRTGYELPATGGAGTEFVTYTGLLCMLGAVVMYRLLTKRRTGGKEQSDNR